MTKTNNLPNAGLRIPALALLIFLISAFNYYLPKTHAASNVNTQPPKPQDFSSHSETESSPVCVTISGTVIDKTTNQPIPNAAVYIDSPQSENESEKQIKTSTDTKGRFTQTLNASDFTKDSEESFRIQPNISVLTSGYALKQTKLINGNNPIADLGIIEMMPGQKIASIVMDTEGNPIESAAVSILDLPINNTVTNKDGSFELDSLDSLNSFSLLVTHPVHPPIYFGFTPLKPGKTLHKKIVMEKGFDIHGHVTNSSGEPISDVQVSINNNLLQKQYPITAATDKYGYYKLDNIPSWFGGIRIKASHDKYATYAENHIIPDIIDNTIDFQMQNPVEISGIIVDTNGIPIPGACVSMYQYKTTTEITDENGIFKINIAPAEELRSIEVSGDNIVQDHYSLRNKQDFHTITVKRPGTIYTRAIDAQIQSPITNLKVFINTSRTETSRGRTGTWSSNDYTLTSPNGLYDMNDDLFPIGAYYEVTIYAKGYEPMRIDPVIIQPKYNPDTNPDFVPQRTLFALKPEVVTDGYVTDSNGNPIPNAMVQWMPLDTRYVHSKDINTAITNQQGYFSIHSCGNIAKGVLVSAMDCAPSFYKIENLPRNNTGILEFTLEKAPFVYGIVTDLKGNPVPNATVAFFPQFNEIPSLRPAADGLLLFTYSITKTNIDGYYEMSGMPTGYIKTQLSWTDTIYGRPHTENSNIFLAPGQTLEWNMHTAASHRGGQEYPYINGF